VFEGYPEYDDIDSSVACPLLTEEEKVLMQWSFCNLFQSCVLSDCATNSLVVVSV
jgi:hypothetical protein